MVVGDTLTLTWMVTPLDATNQVVDITTSSSAIASIDNIDRVNNTCVVTANDEGTATIRVITRDGSRTASVVINVVP